MAKINPTDTPIPTFNRPTRATVLDPPTKKKANAPLNLSFASKEAKAPKATGSLWDAAKKYVPTTEQPATKQPAPPVAETAQQNIYDMNESQLRDFVTKSTQEQIQPTLDIYKKSYGGLQDSYNARIAELEGQKGTVMQPYNDLAEQQKLQNQELYDMAAAQKQQEANRAVEATARRFGMQGFGRSTIHSDEQYILQQQAQNIQQELTRAKLLEDARINAELRGATQQQLGALDEQIMAQKEKVAGLQANLATSEAELKLKALDSGNTSIAGIMEQQLKKQADEDKKLAEYLKSQGLAVNPLTGEYVEDIIARADLLKTQAEIAKTEAETKDLLTPKAEIAVNPVTGDYYDKNTGAIVGNAFSGIVSGGGALGDTGSVVNADKKTLTNIFYQSGKSNYGHGEGKRECGEAYNDITDGPNVGNSYASKLSTVTKRNSPDVGNGLIIPLGGEKFGHIETVISKDPTTGKFKTVSWNRDKKGSQTFQEYSIDELNQKYGNNWGFNDAKLRPQYASALAQVSTTINVPQQASEGATYGDYLQQGIQQGMPAKQAMEYASKMVQLDTEEGRGAQKESFDQSQSLASRYKPLQDEVRTLEQGFSVTKGFNVNTTNPYDDQALIFAFMKVLDPGSVVRENEYTTAQKNTSMLNSLAAGWEQAANGTGTLTPDQRKNILATMRNLYSSKRSAYDQELEVAKNTGLNYGIDPSLYLTVPESSYVQVETPVTRAGYLGSDWGGNILNYLLK